MTDNEIKREKTFSEELPYFKERIKEVFDNYSNPNGYEDPLYIAVLRDSNRIVRKAEEEVIRQQEEIEALIAGQETLQRHFARKEEETERLQNTLNGKAFEFAENRAIKEFADRLKEKSFKAIRNYGLTKDVVEICDIDNLLKEMVGKEE